MNQQVSPPKITDEIREGKIKVFTVCSRMPFPLRHDDACVYDIIAAIALYDSIATRLHGLTESEPSVQSFGTVSRGIALFRVRDLMAAQEAVQPYLENLLGVGNFFVTGYLDVRENFWRSLWPSKPLIDLHQHITELQTTHSEYFNDTLARFESVMRDVEAELKRANAAKIPPPSPQE